MAVSVTPLLQRQGRDVSIARASGDTGTYDPATGTYTPDTPLAAATMRGVLINFQDDEVNETSILSQDRKLLLDATSDPFVPEPGDVIDGIVSGGAVTGGLKIVRVRAIAPNGVPVAYTCQVRG